MATTTKAKTKSTEPVQSVVEESGYQPVARTQNLWVFEDEDGIYFYVRKNVPGKLSKSGSSLTICSTGFPTWVTDTILLSMTVGVRNPDWEKGVGKNGVRASRKKVVEEPVVVEIPQPEKKKRARKKTGA